MRPATVILLFSAVLFVTTVQLADKKKQAEADPVWVRAVGAQGHYVKEQEGYEDSNDSSGRAGVSKPSYKNSLAIDLRGAEKDGRVFMIRLE